VVPRSLKLSPLKWGGSFFIFKISAAGLKGGGSVDPDLSELDLGRNRIETVLGVATSPFSVTFNNSDHEETDDE